MDVPPHTPAMAHESRPRPPMLEVSESTSASSSASSPEQAPYDDTDFFIEHRNDSQSSIGALSLRDMNVSPEQERQFRLSPISRLPPELLIGVFSKLGASGDLKNCMLVSKFWAGNSVDLLWHRPLCNKWNNLANVVTSVGKSDPYFPYCDLVKRLNLSSLMDTVSDGTVTPFQWCKRIERLTLTGCKKLTDQGVMTLLEGSRNLLALDVTGLDSITDHTLLAVARNCGRLQGLNITECSRVTDESLAAVAESCRYLKRLKLNNCSLITDQSVVAVAKNCPSMLEIDLHDCRQVTDRSITELLACGRQLRELRVNHCTLLTDQAFLELPKNLTFESLRILDLTGCVQLHDEAVEKIVDSSPRLRNLVLAKCREVTDRSVMAITRLGKNLHYIHLGHCGNITDDSIVQLVKLCNRIRYIDLACCHRLTDTSVKQLALLPKLRRIGLVKCHNISDRSINALAKNTTSTPRPTKSIVPSLLERVHLSYCLHLTLGGIHALLNQCPKLTHLSLTGVAAFYMRDDLADFCRDAPHEFTEHQRTVFCVFSGNDVNRLRKYLNDHSQSIYDSETTMNYEDREVTDGDNDQQIASLMNIQGINDEEEGEDDDTEPMEGSQFGGDAER